MRTGVRLSVDVGRVRIGLARCDQDAILATPIETLRRDPGAELDLDQILDRAREYSAMEIVVGLPLSLSGQDTASTVDARSLAGQLADASSVPVRLVDERLSTVSAQSALHMAGRGSKKQRSVIDQVAAVIILQHALDTERTTGTPPGSIIERHEGP